MDRLKTFQRGLGASLHSTSLETVSLSQDGEGLGALWGQEKAEEMLSAAGLEDVQVYRIEEDPINCCYVATKMPAPVGSAA